MSRTIACWFAGPETAPASFAAARGAVAACVASMTAVVADANAWVALKAVLNCVVKNIVNDQRGADAVTEEERRAFRDMVTVFARGACASECRLIVTPTHAMATVVQAEWRPLQDSAARLDAVLNGSRR